jgi:hypothetical protein
MGGNWYDPCAVYGYKLDQNYFPIFKDYIYNNYLQEYDDVFCRDKNSNLRIEECIELFAEIKNIPIYTMLTGAYTRWEYIEIDDDYFNIYIGTLYTNDSVIKCEFDDRFDYNKVSTILQELDIDITKLPSPQLHIGCK